MTRQYSALANDDIKRLLDMVANQDTSHQGYQSAMTQLGRHLGLAMLSQLESHQRVYLVATVEDADFLALGVLQQLEQSLTSVGFACFWNDRQSLFNLPLLAVSPILKQYQEPADQIDTLIMVKSIISGGCVVRTNLQNLIQKMQPQQFLIAAPVMYYQAEEALRSAFMPAIADKFQFFYFAKDDERTDAGEVIPGIGGMVYDRLGFDGQSDKNRYVPAIVKQRRHDFIERRRTKV
jgi:hypothetical protein